MDKGKTIKQAFLMLGDNSVFNDNKSDKYKVADELLEEVLDTVAMETDFLFNSITTKLKSIGKNELGEYRFNVPIDYLNIIRTKDECRLEGEFLYSQSSELYIQYCRKIPLSEYPDSMFNVVVTMLAMNIATAFNAYNDRYSLLQQKFEEAKRKMIYQQGYQFNPWGDK